MTTPGKVRWVYRLERDEVFDLGLRFSPALGCDFEGGRFMDRNSKLRLTIGPDGKTTVHAGYAWDGCSPKYVLWDLMIGTPDGVPAGPDLRPKTFRASLIHDALYQFLGNGVPFARRDVDRIFLDELTAQGFAPRKVYWIFVRLFGGIYHGAIRRIRRQAGSMLALQ